MDLRVAIRKVFRIASGREGGAALVPVISGAAPLRRPAVALSLAGALLLWASSFPAIRFGVREFQPTDLVFVRFLVAALTLGAVALVVPFRRPQPSDYGLLLAAAALNAVYHVLLNVGLTRVSSGATAVLVNTVPLFTALWGVLFLGERSHWAMGAGLVVSFAGAVMIAAGEGKAMALSTHALLVLAGAVCWSGYVVIQKPLLTRLRPLDVTAWTFWLGTVMVAPFVVGFLDRVGDVSPAGWVAGVYLGVFATALTYLLWSRVLAAVPAGRAASFLFLVPVLTFVIAAFWLNEIPRLLTLAGGALVLAGVMVSHFAGTRRRALPVEEG